MTGEGVETIIVMLVIVFGIFHMVRKKSRDGLDEIMQKQESKSKDSEES